MEDLKHQKILTKRNMSSADIITSDIAPRLANPILSSCPEVMIELLQKVQNMVTRIILNKHPRDSSTQCLKLLHWLPIWYRIGYKVAMLVFKSIHDMVPKYLTKLLTEKKISRMGLCFANRNKVLTESGTTRKTFASRSFGIYGPTLWNK